MRRSKRRLVKNRYNRRFSLDQTINIEKDDDITSTSSTGKEEETPERLKVIDVVHYLYSISITKRDLLLFFLRKEKENKSKLFDDLLGESTTIIRKLYREIYNQVKVKDLNKISMVHDIVKGFYGNEEIGQVKREKETKNLKEIGIDNNNNEEINIEEIVLCGIIIPDEIIEYIYTFLKIDIWLIDNVGRLNTSFYVRTLKAWDKELVIPHYEEKKGIYIGVFDIPIIVLRRIRKISIGEMNPDSYKHLSNNIIPRSIQSFDVSTITNSAKFKSLFDYFKKKNINCFVNCTKLILPKYSPIVEKSQKWKKEEMLKLEYIKNLHSIFPNVKELKNIYVEMCVKGFSKLKSIGVNYCLYATVFNNLKFLFEKVNGLEVDYFTKVWKHQEYYQLDFKGQTLPKFILEFKNINQLKLFYTHPISFQFLEKCKELEKLEISFYWSKQEDTTSNQFRLPYFTNLNELILHNLNEEEAETTYSSIVKYITNNLYLQLKVVKFLGIQLCFRHVESSYYGYSYYCNSAVECIRSVLSRDTHLNVIFEFLGDTGARYHQENPEKSLIVVQSKRKNNKNRSLSLKVYSELTNITNTPPILELEYSNIISKLQELLKEHSDEFYQIEIITRKENNLKLKLNKKFIKINDSENPNIFYQGDLKLNVDYFVRK